MRFPKFFLGAGILALLPFVVLATATADNTIPETAYQAMQWRLVGPFRGGRVSAVAGNADQPYTYYMGPAGGGVWKTTDGGETWDNISDGFFKTASIGAIAVAPSDPNIIYVGTGEGPVRGVSTSHGDGVYKSADGGKTWMHLGLAETRHIGRIMVHPNNPDIVYVAAQGDAWAPHEERGVYRSLDGGKTWKKTLYVDPSTGASDIVMDAKNPKVLYAAMWDHQRTPWNIRSGGPGSSIWKTTDGGDHWTKLTKGLPGLMGKIGVAVSPANPKRVWAMVEATEGGVYRSDDAGASWTRVNSDPGIRDRGWYYSHIFAHPTDPNTVFVLASPMVVSHDGGATFSRIRTPHGDNHGLWINPKNPDLMIESNDGGANVTNDGGKTWSTQMNQPTAQFYRVETDSVWPYRLYGGQQDSSTVRIASQSMSGDIGEQDWRTVSGGESAFISVYHPDPRYVYGTSLLGGISVFDDKTGLTRSVDPNPEFVGFLPGNQLKYRFNWNAPVLVSQHNADTVYHAAQKVLKSTDRGLTWREISPDLTRARPETMGTTGGPIMIEGAGGETYATITYIAESPHDAKVLWTGSDDGLVYLTRDGGKNWSNVTPKDLPEGQINAIEVSPHDPATAYIAVTRYKLDDFASYAYKTADYGKTWTKITNGLPDGDFVRVIREDPVKRGLLYAGAENGAYVSFDDGANWQPLQLNLPVVPVTDLQVNGDDLVASTQGRSFWILDGLEPLRQVTANSVQEAAHLYKPADALRLDRSRGEGGGGEAAGENPDYGAVIYYSLSSTPTSDVAIDILGEDGDVLRHFSSAAKENENKNLVKGVQGEPPAPPLSKKPGLNRMVWNLRVKPMTEAKGEIIRYVRNRPYRVAPGDFTVRLTAGGKSYEQTLHVAAQPNAPDANAAAWRQQQSICKRLYALVDEDHRMTNRLRMLASEVSGAMKQAHASNADALRKAGQAFIDAELAWEDQVPQAPLPGGVIDRIGYPSHLLSTPILSVLANADQPPPVANAVIKHTDELESQWATLKARGEKLEQQDFSVLKAQFADAGVAIGNAAAE